MHAGLTDPAIHRHLIDALYVEAMVLADEARSYFDDGGRLEREALAPMGERAVVEDDLGRLVDQIVITAQSGDHILVMSNGGFGGIHDKLLAALRAKR